MPPPPQLTALDCLSGVLPYVGAALVGWQVLPALLPAHTLPVLVLLATLPPWHGLPPGLAPLLCLGRLRCWLPYPWALKNRRTELTLILAAVSPVLIPAALLSAVLMAWPIWRDYGKYRQATGEMSGVLSAKAASAQAGEKHDWRKWLNTRWAESFGWRDVTDPHLPILADAVVADPVGFLPSPLPTRSGPRPAMLRGQPHRQVDQVPLVTDKSGQKTVDFSMQSALAQDAFGPADETGKTAMPWVRRCTRSGGDVLLGVPSLFEGTGAKALRFAEPALCDCRSVVAGRKGEFAHVSQASASWRLSFPNRFLIESSTIRRYTTWTAAGMFSSLPQTPRRWSRRGLVRCGQQPRRAGPPLGTS